MPCVALAGNADNGAVRSHHPCPAVALATISLEASNVDGSGRRGVIAAEQVGYVANVRPTAHAVSEQSFVCHAVHGFCFSSHTQYRPYSKNCQYHIQTNSKTRL